MRSVSPCVNLSYWGEYLKGMDAKLSKRIVRGAVAFFALAFAAYEFTLTGFTATTVFASGVGILYGWMAASGKG